MPKRAAYGWKIAQIFSYHGCVIAKFDNVSKDGKIIYLPIYMSMFLRPADIPEKMIYTIDTARQSTERNEY